MSDLDQRIANLPPEKRALLELRLLQRGGRPSSRPEMARRDTTRPAPLSFAQQRLWFLDQLDPGKPLYNMAEALSLRGSLNAHALERALEEIVRRHEILRTIFSSAEGRPLQEVLPAYPVGLPPVDLSGMPAPAREEEAARLAQAEADRPFDLSKDPPLRAKLLRLAGEDHRLLLTTHHIASDGWSVGILLSELTLLYRAFSQGRPSPLPELPVQYADFAAWQREWLSGERLDSELRYWKRQLAGELPVLELPGDRPRPALPSFRGAAWKVEVPKEVTDGIKALARREGATLFMTLLAAFQVLLSRYTGQQDILVGSPIAGRTQVETEELIGFFVNTLVLRGDLSGDPTFRQFLGRTRETALQAYAHQALPFEKIVEELNPERSRSHTPLFQVLFVLQNAEASPLALEGLTVSPLEGEVSTAQFDLTLEVFDAEDGLTAWFEYSTDLFDRPTIAAMGGHLQTLLAGVVADPDRRVSRLPLLTEAERDPLLVGWNETRADYPRGKCLDQLFEEQVERTPGAVAVVSGEETLTYRELNRRANQLAHHLRRIGVGSDSLVALCMERSLEMVVGMLGVLKSGGAYVPFEPTYPRERLAFMLEDARVSAVLTQRRLVDAFPVPPKHLICLDADAKILAREEGGNPARIGAPERLAYVLYTSGSTGKPKGVMIPHRAICNHIHWMQNAFPLTAGDCVLQKTPVSFDVSVWEFYAPLFVGAQLILTGPEGQYDTADVVPLIERHEVTILQAVPSLLAMLVEEDGLQRCHSLKRVFCGGAPLSAELADEFFRRSPAELYNHYGPTEATIDATSWACVREHAGRPIPIGRPIANTRIYVLDSHLQPVPVGVAGELCIAGTGLARGYLNRPALTAEKFLPDPFASDSGSRLYRTGDRARYLRDGNIEFLGRLDDQVKVRGYRIELGEIEAILAGHPGVREAAVMVREDVPRDKRLVAYVAPKWKPAPKFTELRSFLAERLPDYMMPAAFLTLPDLPRLTNGKVDRKALPAPDNTRPELERRYVAPSDTLELQLTQIWEKVLKVRPIGVRDNFFELGGHSLLAVRLFVQIEKLTGKKLPLATLFQAPTVGQLARILRKEGWVARWSSLVAIQPGGSRPPFYCVHAAGGNVLTYRDLASHLGPDQPVYGLQAQGLDGKNPPHTSVEDMAAHYIREVRTLQPEGPYYLGGASAGGIVAFEMARQLDAGGESAAVVALFDTWGPDYGEVLPNMTRLRMKVYSMWERFDLHAGNLLVGTPREKLAYIREKAKRLRKRMRASIRKMRKSPLPRDLRSVESGTRHALENYVPGIYPGRVTLFRASKQPAGYYPDATLGWSCVAAGGVEIYEVPGHHGAIVYEPRIRVLAEKLRLCLEKAQAARPRPAEEAGQRMERA